MQITGSDPVICTRWKYYCNYYMRKVIFMGLRAQDLTLIQRAALLSGQSEWETRRIVKAGIEPIVLSDGPNGIRRQTGSGDHLGLGAS